MRIQHNIAAMNSYRQLGNNNNMLSKNLEKLSSGYRINRAGDDAAGLAISEKMRAQIKGLETAQKNANDGISLVQTAEGALTEVHSMLNRMTELATQSANGTYEDAVDRNNLQKEVESLLKEIDRISESTNFNGINLLNGDLAGVSITTNVPVTRGGGATATVEANAGVAMASGTMMVADDIIGKIGGAAGLDTESFQAGVADTKPTTFSFTISDVQLAGVTCEDNATLTYGVGSKTATLNVSDLEPDESGVISGSAIAQAIATSIGEDAFNWNDGSDDISMKVAVEGNKLTFTAQTNAEDKFVATETESKVIPGITLNASGITVKETPEDEDPSTGATSTDLKAENKNFAWTKLDFTGKTGKDVIGTKFTFNGKEYEFTKAEETAVAAGAAPAATVPIAVNEDDDADDIAKAVKDVLVAQGETAEVSDNGGAVIADGADAEAKGGALSLQVGDTAEGFNKVSVSIEDMGTENLGIADVDISTQGGAADAIQKIKDAINTVSSTRGDLGAIQNRLEHTINNLGVTTENITAAESRIRDTDMASEMMQYTKNNILIQASQAMLAQANQVPQGVLQLLQ